MAKSTGQLLNEQVAKQIVPIIFDWNFAKFPSLERFFGYYRNESKSWDYRFIFHSIHPWICTLDIEVWTQTLEIRIDGSIIRGLDSYPSIESLGENTIPNTNEFIIKPGNYYHSKAYEFFQRTKWGPFHLRDSFKVKARKKDSIERKQELVLQTIEDTIQHLDFLKSYIFDGEISKHIIERDDLKKQRLSGAEMWSLKKP